MIFHGRKKVQITAKKPDGNIQEKKSYKPV